METEDEGLKGEASVEKGTTLSFFRKISAELISDLNFLFKGLKGRGSPKSGLLSSLFGLGDFPDVKKGRAEIFSFFIKSASSTFFVLFFSKLKFLFSFLLKCGSSNPTLFTWLSLESKFKILWLQGRYSAPARLNYGELLVPKLHKDSLYMKEIFGLILDILHPL